MPASVANASLEELQKLFVDSLKKLKARDKKISELTASQDNLQQQLSEAKSSIAVPATADADIEHQLQSAVEEVKEANHRATVAEEQFDTLYKTNVAQQQSLEEAASEKAMHAEQMSSLKEVLRSLAEDKELIEKVCAVACIASFFKRMLCPAMQQKLLFCRN